MVLNTNDLIYEKFEETKGVIRSRKSKKIRKYHGQKRKDKERNNGPHDTRQKTKDCVTWTPIKTTRGSFLWRLASKGINPQDIIHQQSGYLCYKWLRICSVCCTHNPVLSSFMTYHRDCDKSNSTTKREIMVLMTLGRKLKIV
jgi:hypothetical protein